MALLDESERLDFWATVVSAGYSKEDFNLKEIEGKPTDIGTYAITGTVIVERTSTCVSRRYSAGHATTWLVDFDAELRGHIFGDA
jgi:hypothetical protein